LLFLNKLSKNIDEKIIFIKGNLTVNEYLLIALNNNTSLIVIFKNNLFDNIFKFLYFFNCNKISSFLFRKRVLLNKLVILNYNERKNFELLQLIKNEKVVFFEKVNNKFFKRNFCFYEYF